MCDETTDRGVDKQLVILARLCVAGKVVTRFIDMPTCNLSTAQDLFDALNESLR
jgi:hypothetical protein